MRALVLGALLAFSGCMHISPDLQRQQCVDGHPPRYPTCDEQEQTRAAVENAQAAAAWANIALSLTLLSHALSHCH